MLCGVIRFKYKWTLKDCGEVMRKVVYNKSDTMCTF